VTAAAFPRVAVREADEPTYRCGVCQDEPAGWLAPMSCPIVRCTRTGPHVPHTFTARCPCWLRRNTDRIALARQAAVEKGRPVPSECDDIDDVHAGRYRYGRHA
jgi:hypothetical protein